MPDLPSLSGILVAVVSAGHDAPALPSAETPRSFLPLKGWSDTLPGDKEDRHGFLGSAVEWIE